MSDNAPADAGGSAATERGDAATPAGTPAPRRWRRLAARATTALAAALVVAALLLPNRLGELSPGAFVRLPVEALLGAAVVLVLPPRARRVAAVFAGVGLALLTILKIVDIGFYAVLARRFDPVLDWEMFRFAAEALTGSIGRGGAIAAVAAAVALAGALLVLMPMSVLRLSRAVVRHHVPARRAVAVLGVLAVACAAFGVRLVPEEPAAAVAVDRARLLYVSALDQQAYAEEVAVDAFRDTPGDQLLTALRGKDVIVAFIESYGRDAVEDPEFAPQVGAVLANGQRRLAAAGYTAASGFLTSPTAGGNSWLAHATLLSGVWIDNQGRHRKLMDSDRFTLNGAFERAGWRTVGVMPLVVRDWPEGEFYGYDRLLDHRALGYWGPRFSMGTIPDQFTLSAFQRLEHGRADRPPIMAEIALVSSHGPWAPLPRFIDWGAIDHGPAFNDMAAAAGSPEDLWGDDTRVRAAYRTSIEYTLTSLLSYVETYGDDDLVLVMLGDHQPAPVVTGDDASRDVPISIVSRDRAVLDRISGWGWQPGLKPGPDAPVWGMETFRDRFLTAYGPAAPAG